MILTFVFVLLCHWVRGRFHRNIIIYLADGKLGSRKMAKTEREEELERRIRDLESEVASLKSEAPKRSRISEMSAEVVDSNPYRCLN